MSGTKDFSAQAHLHQSDDLYPTATPPDISLTTPATSVTPVDFIYGSMIPLSKMPIESETVELASLGKRKRCDAVTSSDLFLRSEDLTFDGSRLQSADFVKDLLKSDLSSAYDDGKRSTEKERKIISLSAKLDRITSGDWMQDFRGESVDLIPMHPSMMEEAAAALPPLDWYEESEMPLTDSSMPPLPPLHALPLLQGPVDEHDATTIASKKIAVAELTSTTNDGEKKKKRRKPRKIDESRSVDPTDGDVLFGRGGWTNTHPGNIAFRRRALEMRPWYESSTKDEKQRIADVLVESVKSEGHRFLEKGEDGLWHEVIGNGAHTKASQALRERIGKRRKIK
jgi:hypothetical protein